MLRGTGSGYFSLVNAIRVITQKIVKGRVAVFLVGCPVLLCRFPV